VMMRKSVLDAHRIQYDRSLEPAEDYDLWARLSHHGQLHNLDQVLLQYRIHDANESVLKKEKQDRAVVQIRKKIISAWVEDTEPILDVLSSRNGDTVFSEPALRQLLKFAKQVHASKFFNKVSLYEILTPIFIQCCKQSELKGYQRFLLYVQFPKHVFSFRTSLSLLLNV
jgi:hypothetical protein